MQFRALMRGFGRALGGVSFVLTLLFASQTAYADTDLMDVEGFYSCLEATEASASDNRLTCIEAASGPCLQEYFTASGKATCAGQEAELWDALLNNTYNDLMDVLAGQARKNLRAAQRAWIKMRDKDCGLYRVIAGVDGAPIDQLHQQCLLNATAIRVNSLTELAEIARQLQ